MRVALKAWGRVSSGGLPPSFAGWWGVRAISSVVNCRDVNPVVRWWSSGSSGSFEYICDDLSSVLSSGWAVV